MRLPTDRNPPLRRVWRAGLARFCLETVLAIGLLGALSACDAPRPPKGRVLSLKGNKGAVCLRNRDCASNECVQRRCTEKIEKVGLGGECKSDRYCQKGFYCDTQAKKCAPVVKCEEVAEPLKRCMQDVFLAFRPSQKQALLRLRARSRRRVLERARRRLYRSLCQLTRHNSLTFRRAAGLQKALRITECAAFATAFHKAVGK